MPLGTWLRAQSSGKHPSAGAGLRGDTEGLSVTDDARTDSGWRRVEAGGGSGGRRLKMSAAHPSCRRISPPRAKDCEA
ncbi:unnamed protein product [Boreogadus saida]